MLPYPGRLPAVSAPAHFADQGTERRRTPLAVSALFPLRARLGLSIFTPCPALSPGPDLPQRISLGQPPSLHLLRGVRYSPVFVRRLLGYYGPVRLPAPVRRCRAPCGFTARTPTPLRAKCGTSRLPCMSLPCVRGVSDHAGAEQLLR